MSFELNLAIIPNRIYYLEGVQLSYIKIYVHIFNLWHSDNLCFIGVPEFIERTKLSKTTVYEALAYFEKIGEIKRVKKGTKTFILQPVKAIETDESPVDKSAPISTNSVQHSVIAERVSALAENNSAKSDYNNKYNNKYNKSSYMGNEQKKSKHVDNSISSDSGRADVTKQTTSYNPKRLKEPSAPSPLLAEHMKKKGKNVESKADKLPTGTTVQSEIPSRSFTDVQGSTIDARGCQDIPPNVRGSDRLLEARGVYSFLEEAGMAGENRAHQHSKS